MSAPGNMVIVGGGLAGAKAAEALRERGFDGAITLIAAEDHLPYERPPLSKSYLSGESPFEDAVVQPAQWYSDARVKLLQGKHASSIDPAAHEVQLADGSRLSYGKLLLATGAAPRRLSVPGTDTDNVHYLRTREDADAIRATFGPGRRLVIVGAGWIGLEVAAAARQAGTEVTVIETAELPLLAVLGRELAQVFADLHTEHGVTLRLGATLQSLSDDGSRATGAVLADGTQIPADDIVVGIGVAPRVELPRAAGLEVDNGVLVDAGLRSSNPDIYAVGDIANQAHPTLGVRVRVEHWASALNQPATAAAGMLGESAQYTELPYFFSDQYDLGMEYIGHAPKGSYSRVLARGDLAGREFVAFWLDDVNRIKAAMNVNVWDVLDEIKPLIEAGTRVDPQRLGDPAVPYTELAKGS